MISPKSQTAIVGAGITGLQTALSLLSTNQHDVVIIAQHFPTDRSIEYTSPWAGGVWRSHALDSPEDAEVRAWDTETYHTWKRMLFEAEKDGKSKQEVEREVGLGVRECVLYYSEESEETRNEGEGLWWRNMVWGFEVLQDEERRRMERESGKKVVFAVKYETICINVPCYLKFVLDRVEALGGKLIQATARVDGGLDGVISDVRRIVASNGYTESLDTVILATGLSSKKFLTEDEAQKLYPIRGQTVLVKGEAPKAVMQVSSPEEISYVIPRPESGTTILGGCKQRDNWDEEEDSNLTSDILNRAKALVPELLGADGKFVVLSVQVGRRPGRRGGPRVEFEREMRYNMTVIHAYGHAGAGYQSSIGSAAKIVKLLTTK